MPIPAMWRRIAQSLLVTCMVWTGVGVAFPQTPNDVKVEIFHTGVWNNISTDVFDRATSPRITITRGRPDEGSRCDPGYATLSINNRTGKYSPRNPVSPLYGKIGRNTPIRISVTHNAITYVRFVGEITAWPSRWDLSENDVWVPIEAYGILRRLGQGASPVLSPLRRAVLSNAITGGTLLAYWPLEDGSQASQLASALPGGNPMNIADDLLVGDDATLLGSLPLPKIQNTVTTPILGAIDTSAAAGPLVFDFWGLLFTGSLTAIDAYLGTGNGVKWNVFVDSAGQVNIYREIGGTLTFVFGTSAFALDVWHNYRLTLTQNGANVDIAIIVDGASAGSGSIAETLSRPTDVEFRPFGVNSFGHVNVWDGIPSVNFYQAGLAHAGELITTRLQRLCDEEAISMAVTGTSNATMGPQRIAALLELLDDVVGVDRGFLFEQRTAVGLAYRTNRSKFNQ